MWKCIYLSVCLCICIPGTVARMHLVVCMIDQNAIGAKLVCLFEAILGESCTTCWRHPLQYPLTDTMHSHSAIQNRTALPYPWAVPYQISFVRGRLASELTTAAKLRNFSFGAEMLDEQHESVLQLGSC